MAARWRAPRCFACELIRWPSTVCARALLPCLRRSAAFVSQLSRSITHCTFCVRSLSICASMRRYLSASRFHLPRHLHLKIVLLLRGTLHLTLDGMLYYWPALCQDLFDKLLTFLVRGRHAA
eukprot:27303_6